MLKDMFWRDREGAPVERFFISDVDESGDSKYFGYLSPEGCWYVMRQDTAGTTFRYASGVSGYSAAWSGRAGLTYSLFSGVI